MCIPTSYSRNKYHSYHSHKTKIFSNLQEVKQILTWNCLDYSSSREKWHHLSRQAEKNRDIMYFLLFISRDEVDFFQLFILKNIKPADIVKRTEWRPTYLRFTFFKNIFCFVCISFLPLSTFMLLYASLFES